MFFKCDCDKCKSRCCRNGTYVPIHKGEKAEIERLLPDIEKMLPEENIAHIRNGAISEYSIKSMPTGCPFLIRRDEGYRCAFQLLGDKDFPKPLSCHLFPLVQKGDGLVYEPRMCCNPGIMRGFMEKVTLEEFLTDALKRFKTFKIFNYGN